MSDKNFMVLIGLIIVAVVGSIVFFGGEDSNTADGFIGDPLQVARGIPNEDGQIQRADHTKGPDDARVTLIEYADFECPACFAFFPELQELEAAYPDDLQIVYRHNPLSSIHPNAFAAHRAAVAADNQNAFWEMHDRLIETLPSWSAAQAGLDISAAASLFESYAEDLGLDMEQYRADVQSQSTFDFIDSHLESGNALGVTGTPTIFINGERIEERTFEDLSAIIDGILAEEPAATSEDTPAGVEVQTTEAPEEDVTDEPAEEN